MFFAPCPVRQKMTRPALTKPALTKPALIKSLNTTRWGAQTGNLAVLRSSLSRQGRLDFSQLVDRVDAQRLDRL